MRFVIAIAAFLVAAVMIGVGIAQRTVWAPAPSLTAAAAVQSDVPYVVISGSTLNANSGQQTLAVTGAASPFVAYGRTNDVTAWVGNEPYARVSYDAATRSLKSTVVNAGDSGTSGGTSGATDASTAPNPSGSDLWLEQFTGAKAAKTTMDVPDGVSVIIATDGAHPAPSHVSLTWPMDTRTPWAGPLLVLGGALAAAGIVFYVLAIRYLRRGRGPRRGGGGGRRPRVPRTPRLREIGPPSVEAHGRRAVGRSMIAVPVVLVGAIALTGCSSDYWPAIGQSGTPTPSSAASSAATPLASQLATQQKDQPAPAVTEPQLRNIVARIAATAKTADATLNPTLAATRFTGPALTERETNYKIRHAKPKYPAAAPIPVDAKLYPVLPQATDSWPRVVNVLAADSANTSAAPVDLTLVQQTPRDNYKVAYSVVMLAKARIPDLAPANIGAAIVPPDSKLLSVPPSQLAEDYASILKLGAKSPSEKLFDLADDSLAKAVGADVKAETEKSWAAKKSAGTLGYVDEAGTAAPVALATNDAGALVVTSVQELQTVKPTDPAAEIGLTDPAGATAALLGLTKTNKGLETDYSYQLLFYVPPVESKEQIRLLGFAQAVTGARELK